MDTEAYLLLDDYATQRLVLAWPHVPPGHRASSSDRTASWAALAGVSPALLLQREGLLFRLGVLGEDGTVASEAQDRLRAIAIERAFGRDEEG